MALLPFSIDSVLLLVLFLQSIFVYLYYIISYRAGLLHTH